MSDDAQTLIRHHSQLAGTQANFRRYWEEIAYYVMPSQATFLTQPVEGLRRTERLFDSTAVMANEHFAAAIEQMLTPRTQEWHGLSPQDTMLAEDQEVKEYLDRATELLFALRYRPKANFASQTHECYMSLGAFGNTALYIDDDVGVGPRYRSIPLQELNWANDHVGRVDTVYRKYKLQARQAYQRFGKNLPAAIIEAARGASGEPFKEFDFLHCTRPNEEYQARLPGPKGMKYASFYVAYESQSIIEAGGFPYFPYAIGRYTMSPRENYGRSPAMACFPAIRTLNEEKKSILRAGQKVVDPPILAYEEGVLEAFNQRPGAMNYGMLTADGQPLVQPFKIDANIPLGVELMDIERKEINDAFLVSLFQILVENPQMTATEALIRAQEKGTMLAPTMGRQQSEFIGPIIEAEIYIASQYGWLGKPPEQLMQRGGGYKIEYKSQLSRSMRAAEGTAIMQTIQAAAQMAPVNPAAAAALDMIDFDGSLREIADINGMPAKLLLTEDQVAAIRQQRTQAQGIDSVVQGAPQVSASALNLAKADQASAQASQLRSPQVS